ncbi:MAG: ROK family protein [bacterium]|nr:ROK family protein [bacterium]
MVLAIDVGGTKTLLAVFNRDCEKQESVKFETPKDYPTFIRELASNVASLTTKRFRVCAIAIPGKIDRDNGVGLAFGNLPWENVPILADVSGFLKCPAYLENDANLAGLAEANYVKDKYKRVLYITVSTGIGGVIITNGDIDQSLRDAEVGHMLLEHEDKLQRWEEFASGKALVARTGKRASEIPEGDPEWYTVARNIAIGLINVIANVTPDCIIIGGGVGTHLEKFSGRLVEELEIYEDKLLNVPPILKAQNPEEAVVNGCCIYANQLA